MIKLVKNEENFLTCIPNIFDKKYFNNDLNLHKLRADSAKEYYEIQLHRILNEPGYASILEAEIKKAGVLVTKQYVKGRENQSRR